MRATVRFNSPSVVRRPSDSESMSASVSCCENRSRLAIIDEKRSEFSPSAVENLPMLSIAVRKLPFSAASTASILPEIEFRCVSVPSIFPLLSFSTALTLSSVTDRLSITRVRRSFTSASSVPAAASMSRVSAATSVSPFDNSCGLSPISIAIALPPMKPSL